MNADAHAAWSMRWRSGSLRREGAHHARHVLLRGGPKVAARPHYGCMTSIGRKVRLTSRQMETSWVGNALLGAMAKIFPRT
eukprot:2588264-Pyramimonas_sp.AAC.1